MTQLILTVSNWFDIGNLKNKITDYFVRREQSRQIKNTIKELSQLSDKELWDIGITRGDIWSVAHEVHYDDRIKTNKNLRGWV